MRRLATLAAGLAAAGAAFPAAASAHGLVGRADLPIPPWLFGWAAAVVLIVSFLALAVLWPQPRLEKPKSRRLFTLPRWVDPVCGLVGIAAFAVVLYSAWAGTALPTQNLAPTFVYVIFWVGFPVASVLFGDVFRAFSPWRALALGVAWSARRVARGAALPEPLPYPDRLGRWPAAATILAFGWLELVFVNKSEPAIIGALAGAYALVQLIGMTVYGIEPWSERADGFGALFGLFARLSPFSRRGRELRLRAPLGGAPGLTVVPGTVALLCVAIGTTTFDGFSAGPIWNRLLPGFTRSIRHLGLGFTTATELAATVGLLVCVALVSALYAAGVRGMRTVERRPGERDLGARFVHSLIPIALAYAVAHYFSLLAYQGQAMGYLVSDPLGHGANLFGTHDATIDYGIIAATGIWYVQVGALVLGHVAGLLLAHDRALVLYRDAGDAVRSQAWMLVVMVGFTSLGLWLLSSVNQ